MRSVDAQHVSYFHGSTRCSSPDTQTIEENIWTCTLHLYIFISKGPHWIFERQDHSHFTTYESCGELGQRWASCTCRRPCSVSSHLCPLLVTLFSRNKWSTSLQNSISSLAMFENADISTSESPRPWLKILTSQSGDIGDVLPRCHRSYRRVKSVYINRHRSIWSSDWPEEVCEKRSPVVRVNGWLTWREATELLKTLPIFQAQTP